jgi:hypothetical protein
MTMPGNPDDFFDFAPAVRTCTFRNSYGSRLLSMLDSRDRVFGLLGIIPERYREFIVPDYSQTFHALIQEIV